MEEVIKKWEQWLLDKNREFIKDQTTRLTVDQHTHLAMKAILMEIKARENE